MEIDCETNICPPPFFHCYVEFGVLSIGDEAKILGPLENSQEVLAVLEYLRMKSYTWVPAVHEKKSVMFADLGYVRQLHDCYSRHPQRLPGDRLSRWIRSRRRDALRTAFEAGQRLHNFLQEGPAKGKSSLDEE